jgi:hypothetical protein
LSLNSLVQLAEVEGLSLDDLAGGGALVFDEAPVGVVLAVLVALVTTEEKAHDRPGYRDGKGWEGGGSSPHALWRPVTIISLGFRRAAAAKIAWKWVQLRKSG